MSFFVFEILFHGFAGGWGGGMEWSNITSHGIKEVMSLAPLGQTLFELPQNGSGTQPNRFWSPTKKNRHWPQNRLTGQNML